MKRRRIHISQSVEGALKNWRSRDWRNCVMDTDKGRYLTPDEVRDWLFEQHGKGVRLIPLGECEGHDPITGCPGHDVP